MLHVIVSWWEAQFLSCLKAQVDGVLTSSSFTTWKGVFPENFLYVLGNAICVAHMWLSSNGNEVSVTKK